MDVDLQSFAMYVGLIDLGNLRHAYGIAVLSEYLGNIKVLGLLGQIGDRFTSLHGVRVIMSLT